MQHTRQRLTRILLSLCCMAVFISPVLANQASRLLGTDTPENRALFTHNIQALEHLLLGPQTYHQDIMLPHLWQAEAWQLNASAIADYSSAYIRARQLHFTWVDPRTWRKGWQPFRDDLHQGPYTAFLTPLTDLNFSRIPSDLDPLASRPARWSVCRVAVQETYLYGYYDGVHPYCTLGAPHTLQWERTTRSWQQSFPLETAQPLPHQHPNFSVLPVADIETLSAERLLATLIRATQQTRGFAIDHAVDRNDTRWPTHTMGYRLGRLVNATGIIDFTLYVPPDFTLFPTECQITFELPGPNASDSPRHLHYFTASQAYGKAPDGNPRYRCQMEASELKQWLKLQQPQHPGYITDTLRISDIAFLAVQLHYNLQYINTTPHDYFNTTVNQLLLDIPALQLAMIRDYYETLPYTHDFPFSLRTFNTSQTARNYAARNQALKTLLSLDLVNHPIYKIQPLIHAAFPGEEGSQIYEEWKYLSILTAYLIGIGHMDLSLNQLQAHLKVLKPTQPRLRPLFIYMVHTENSPTEHLLKHTQEIRTANTNHPVLRRTYRIQQTLQLPTQNPGEHLTHYPLPIDSSHQLSSGESPVLLALDTLPERPITHLMPLKSYAHDNLQHTAGAIGWTLTPVDTEGNNVGYPQHSADLNNRTFNVSPGQRYRLAMDENSEAWSTSSLSLAEGTLEEFIADDQTDNSYFLTFSEYRGDINLAPRTVPVIFHAHHRTHGGHTYDIDLRFSGRFYFPTLWVVQDEIDNTILKATPRPQLSQPLLGIQINAAVENDQLIALDTTLALTNTSGRDLKIGPQIAWSLSTCLATHNQDSDACQYIRPLTSFSSEDNNALSFIQRMHLYHLPNITLDNTQPQQLFVRVPQTDNDGNIRGYRQRWYTIFDPQ